VVNKIGLPWVVGGDSGTPDWQKPFGKLKTSKDAGNMAQKVDYEHQPHDRDTIAHGASEHTTQKNKHDDKPTLNQLGQELANQVHDDIKKVDPQNIAGAIPPFLDQMKKMLNNTDPMNALKGMVGGGGYGTMMSTNAQNENNNSQGIIANQPKPGDPCSLDDGTQGTLQYNANSELVCVNTALGITIRPITGGA
jgi:hypothetical protein